MKDSKRWDFDPMQSPEGRAMMSKGSNLAFKVCTKMLFKLAQIPMTNKHDPESFFAAWKSTWADIFQCIKTNASSP